MQPSKAKEISNWELLSIILSTTVMPASGLTMICKYHGNTFLGWLMLIIGTICIRIFYFSTTD